MNRPTPFRD